MWYVTANMVSDYPIIVQDIRVEEFDTDPELKYWHGPFKKFKAKEEAEDFAWEVKDRDNHWNPLLKGYRVVFADGNIIHTEMNCDIKDARKYYIGREFNFGDTDECPRDNMVKAISVERIS